MKNQKEKAVLSTTARKSSARAMVFLSPIVLASLLVPSIRVAPSASGVLGVLVPIGALGKAAAQDSAPDDSTTSPQTTQPDADSAGGTPESASGSDTSDSGAQDNNDSQPSASDSGAQDSAGQDSGDQGGDSKVDAGAYAVQLRDLERRINGLKEQVFRSKSRLSLLAETVLQGVVAGAQAKIVHENKMSSSYKLVRMTYGLDGAPVFNQADEEGLVQETDRVDVYNGSIVPGEHTITVDLEYRGHGYGVFSYLKGYRFKVHSSYTFTAPERKVVEVRVVGYEKGGPIVPIEDRPAIGFRETVLKGPRRAPVENDAAQPMVKAKSSNAE